MKRCLAWLLVCVPALPLCGQTINPANQINWPQVVGSGAPSAACSAINFGQPYTDNTAHQNYTCGSAGWFLTGGGGTSTFTSNIGVGANGSAAYAPVSEVNYLTTSGTTAFACQEDHNKGIWDVRCIRNGVTWVSNSSQALTNTIQAAMCYYFTTSGAVPPQVNLPAGNASLGGNISIPPGLDLEGVPGTQYGTLTNLTTTDPTKPMITQAFSQNFTCNGNTFTANTGVVTVGNISFHGAGSTNANDVGIMNATSGGTTIAFTHNVALQNFGGPGRDIFPSSNGQNSRGDHIFFASDLQWYYFSGAYNPTGFTDTNPHCSVNLSDLDSKWDHIEGFGQLQDTGYFNRYYLSNVCLGGVANVLTDSFIQIAPHNVWLFDSSQGAQRIQGNRFDDSWWDSVHIGNGAGGLYADNEFLGYCTSPTLNPANFPSNPGGVSTDPNCAAIEVGEGALGSIIRDNSIGEFLGLWPAWPVWGIFLPQNVTNQTPTTVDQPGSAGAIGPPISVGGAPLNPGGDVSRSMYDITNEVHNNVGGTLHFQYFKHISVNDTTPTTYNNFDGLYRDAYVTIYLSANDTIINSAAFQTCTGSNLAGTGSWTWWWNLPSVGLLQLSCPSGGGGGGGISGLTTGFFPIATSPTTIGNSVLDYNITNPNVVTSTKPVAVQDASGLGGGMAAGEGTAPTGASSKDFLWADSTAHDWKMNNNNGGATNIVGIATPGTSGDNVVLAANGKDLVDAGAPPSGSTPTFTAGTGAGTGPTISFTSGANDESGWINVTTGTSPAASAGIVTIIYGGTYATIRKCSVDPANGAAGILTTSGRPFVSVSTSTTTQFVITVGTTALVASTAYQWLYRCSK